MASSHSVQGRSEAVTRLLGEKEGSTQTRALLPRGGVGTVPGAFLGRVP